MTYKELTKIIQAALNKEGENLVVDGVWGNKTQAAFDKYQIDFLKDNMTPPVIDIKQDYFEPVFVFHNDISFKNRGNYKTSSGKFKGLTVHYTVSGRSPASAKSVLKYLSSQGYMCMVMDENGHIHIPKGFDVMKHWGYHSGVSKWKGRSSVSDIFAGMEICCWGRNPPSSVPASEIRTVTTAQGYVVAGKYQKYTLAQEKHLINFILWAKANNSEFDIAQVAGHDELRKEAGKLGDKQDPGGSLSMTMPQLRKLVSG